MGDPMGISARVSSQKQNCEAWSGPKYRATAESSPGCGGGSGQDVTQHICIDTFVPKIMYCTFVPKLTYRYFCIYE